MNSLIALLNQLPVNALLVLSAASVITGDYFAKYWSLHQNSSRALIITFIGYFFSSFFYIPTLLREGLVTTATIWSLLSFIGFLVIGIAVYHEQLTKMQTLGVGLGIIALIILSVSHS